MRQDFLVFGRPTIEEAEIAEVVATLRSGWIGTGPRVARFEEMFREYIGARHAVALNSCSAALHLSMVASGVGSGDEVITTPLTFCRPRQHDECAHLPRSGRRGRHRYTHPRHHGQRGRHRPVAPAQRGLPPLSLPPAKATERRAARTVRTRF